MTIDQNNLSENPFKNINVLDIALIFVVISVSFIVYHYNTKDIQLKIAYKGYGPQDYINHKMLPQNFKKDWPNGIMAYDLSLPMKAYYFMYKYFGTSPSATIYPFMFTQTLIFLSSVAFLTQTLFQNKFVTIISIFIVPLSNLAGLNLSRFGNGFGSYLSFPLFYAYANACRIFALGFFLKDRFILMFVFLALAIYCHVTMGFIALAFIGGYLILKPRLFLDKFLKIGMLAFTVLTIPHIYLIFSHNAVNHSGIPVDQWVKATRIFGFHWYPITMKLFTKNAHREFFPLLVLCFSFFMSLKYQDIKDEKTLKILSGIIICLIISVLGIIFSDIYPIPYLIKFSLQRSIGMISFFGVLYLIYYLYKKIHDGSVIVVFIALYSLICLGFTKPGIVLFPILLLLYNDISENQLGPFNFSTGKRKRIRSVYFLAIILVLLVSLAGIFNTHYEAAKVAFGYLWTPLQYFNPFYNFDFLLRGGNFKVQNIFLYLVIFTALSAFLIYSIRSVNNRIVNKLFTSFFIIASLSAVWYFERNKYLEWHDKYSEDSSAYLDVQLWAKNNTDADSLFMPDPSHFYGWRDFSKRSSFGNLREWGYNAIAYNPKLSLITEGIKRMNDFGINIEEISELEAKNSKKLVYSQVLSDEIKKKFYEMIPENLRVLSQKYKINFIVMNKEFHLNQFDEFKVAYENKYYIVYQIG